MASIDKAAIVFSIAIALVGVAVAAVGSSVDNSPAAPNQQMSSAMQIQMQLKKQQLKKQQKQQQQKQQLKKQAAEAAAADASS